MTNQKFHIFKKATLIRYAIKTVYFKYILLAALWISKALLLILALFCTYRLIFVSIRFKSTVAFKKICYIKIKICIWQIYLLLRFVNSCYLEFYPINCWFDKTILKSNLTSSSGKSRFGLNLLISAFSRDLRIIFLWGSSLVTLGLCLTILLPNLSNFDLVLVLSSEFSLSR